MVLKYGVREVSDYVIKEAERYAKILGQSLYYIDVKSKERYGTLKIKFSILKKREDIILIIEDERAYFLKRKDGFFRIGYSKVIIAEWNDFADPFEVALSIQMKLYRALKNMLMRENSYECSAEEFTSADALVFEEFTEMPVYEEDENGGGDECFDDVLFSYNDIIRDQPHSSESIYLNDDTEISADISETAAFDGVE